MKDNYVLVPPEDAELLNEIKVASEKGHSTEVKYIKRSQEWVFFENNKRKRTIKHR